MTADHKQQLLSYLEKLSEADAATLVRFAAFLAQEKPAQVLPVTASVGNESIPQPKVIPRPDQERVVDAIKRLSETYFMLDKKKLLHETSGLVASHVMGGKPAKQVIDEMETAFRRAYDQLLGQQPRSS